MDKMTMMSSLVREWKVSGMTREAFAKRHGISAHTLEYWSRKLKKEGDRLPIENSLAIKPSSPPSFIEIASNHSDVSADRAVQIEFELPSGMRIKIF
jgi:transposase-like protein